MKRAYIFSLTLGLIGLLQGCSTASRRPSENLQPTFSNSSVRKDDLMREVKDILLQCQKVKPGMTREDLLKTFTIEGGIYTATHRRFVYRECPYVKVDVDFILAPGQDVLDQQPTDVIKKISEPFLEWGISD